MLRLVMIYNFIYVKGSCLSTDLLDRDLWVVYRRSNKKLLAVEEAKRVNIRIINPNLIC